MNLPLSAKGFYWVIVIGLVFALGVNINSGILNFWGWLFDPELIPKDKWQVAKVILIEVRLPRVLLALTVGFVLGVSGAVMQGFLRNPLAGPDLLGITNCAALGAVVMLYFGFAAIAWYFLPLGGMLGACLSVLLIFLLAGSDRGVLSVILAGVAINAFAGALIALSLNFSNNPYAMSEIVFWLMGSFSNRSLQDVAIALPFMLAGCAILLGYGRFLDALSLGEDTAMTLGFNLKACKTRLVIALALAIGAAVSVSGSIGFVGLMVPHLCRPFVRQPGRLLLISGLAGALLMTVADILVQRISLNQELKLGVVTAILGGPFFLYLIAHLRQEKV